MGVTSQLTDLIDQINATSMCKVNSGCTGKLKPACVRLAGLGGAVEMTFSCSGCKKGDVTFCSSVEHEISNQTVVGLALQVAFACAGCTHAKYHRALELGLGLRVVTETQYHKTLELMTALEMTLICLHKRSVCLGGTMHVINTHVRTHTCSCAVQPFVYV